MRKLKQALAIVASSPITLVTILICRLQYRYCSRLDFYGYRWNLVACREAGDKNILYYLTTHRPMVEASHVFAKLLDVWHTCTFRHGKYNHIEGYLFDSYNEMQTEMESTVLDKPKCVQWKWVWYLGLYGLRQEFDKREDVMECYTQEPWLKDRGVIDSATRAKRVSVLHQNDSGLFDRHLQEKRLKKQTG